jgi:ABC-2 type transport system permease protein
MTRAFAWSLRRELWEHRAILYAPLAVAALVVVAMAFNARGLREKAAAFAALAPDAQVAAVALPFGLAASTILLTGFVVAVFYCIDALYAERRDRSILFWKSLPVSDRDTVISKSLTALFVGPLIAVAFALVLSLLVLFSLMVLAAFHGLNLFGLVLGDKNFYLVFLQILSFIPVYVLWALPTVGYLLFVSSWAKTKPFLWAVGVPVLGGVILTWVNALAGSPFVLQGYWKVIVARGLGSVFPGSWLGQVSESNANINPDNAVSMLIANTYSLLGTANLWIGVAIGLAFLFGAVKMRRYRDEG